MPRPSRPPRQSAPVCPAPRTRRRSARRVGGSLALVVLAAGATGACGPTVQVEVAPHAADPLCASVVLALPDELATYPRLGTTSQATTAWGDPAAPIVLRCGVEPPGPTTDKCVTATDGAGTSVDWLAVESADPDGDSTWTFTTYGREPAVEVSVPPEVTNENSTSFLVDLAAAVTKTTQLRACV